MEDYTLSELVQLDSTVLSEAIDARKENLMHINQTIDNFPESPNTKKRLKARRDEMLIIRVLEITEGFKQYYQ